MTRDEVLKLANDMAFMACIWIDDEGNEVNDLVKFAELVAAIEREECAKEADKRLHDFTMLTSNPPQSGAAFSIANAIRNRTSQL